MRGLGTAVNVATVLAGTAVGMLVGARLPDRVRATLLCGGGLVGEVIDIEGRLDRPGERCGCGSRKARDTTASSRASSPPAWCSASGLLTILGSVQDGLHANHQLLFVKAGLDGPWPWSSPRPLARAVIGIGIRVLDLRPLRVGSFLPALVIAPVAVGLFAR